MKTFFVSYDLGVPESYSDYIKLSDYLKSIFGTWARPVKSDWIVKSDLNAANIRDLIMSRLDSNDKLIVIEISKDWATYNISSEVTEWMKNNL